MKQHLLDTTCLFSNGGFVLHALSYEFALMSKKSNEPSANDCKANGLIVSVEWSKISGC